MLAIASEIMNEYRYLGDVQLCMVKVYEKMFMRER